MSVPNSSPHSFDSFHSSRHSGSAARLEVASVLIDVKNGSFLCQFVVGECKKDEIFHLITCNVVMSNSESLPQIPIQFHISAYFT